MTLLSIGKTLIVPFASDNIAKVPNANIAVPGVSLIRGDVITVIDMLQVLEGRKMPDVGKAMTLVCEFNQLKVAFAIEEVIGTVL